MSEDFERDVIARLVRLETQLMGLDTAIRNVEVRLITGDKDFEDLRLRMDRLERGNKNHHLGSMAGGSLGAFIMAGVAVMLKLLGWL